MSNFKEMLEEDINIFLNLEEFAEPINIDGQEINGVIEYLERDFKEEDLTVLTTVSVVLYLPDVKFLKKYKQGKAITVNNTTYIVNNSYLENSMRIIKLEENTGY